MTIISIIGLGVVGGALAQSLTIKKVTQKNFDKFKKIGKLEDCLKSDIIFLCLPTPYSDEKKEYDKTALNETVEYLSKQNYSGLVVAKSTVEPKTTDTFYEKYPNLNFSHNPEFLTAKTAFEDFHNQKHVVLGMQKNCNQELYQKLVNFYRKHYPNAKISECDCTESESMKIFVNSFYASKIQLFNEYYLLCQKTGADFEKVRTLMLANDWINPMHTLVPGTDGKLSYGGACFPKDTNALNRFMERQNTPNTVLESVIKERNQIRN